MTLKKQGHKFQLEYIKGFAENLKFCLEETGHLNRTILLNGLNGILEAAEVLEQFGSEATQDD